MTEEQKILGFCNRFRAVFKKRPKDKLSKGILGDPRYCPIAKTIGLRVEVSDQDIYYDGYYYDLPKYVRHFIEAFDEGKREKFNANPKR